MTRTQKAITVPAARQSAISSTGTRRRRARRDQIRQIELDRAHRHGPDAVLGNLRRKPVQRGRALQKTAGGRRFCQTKQLFRISLAPPLSA